MSSAKISVKAQIGTNVTIGDFTIIHDNVEIGDDSVIESHCNIGQSFPGSNGTPLVIGSRSLVRSHSLLYEGSSFGEELETGFSVLIREGTIAGRGMFLGNHSEIHGVCQIGNYLRTHSEVHISRGSVIEDFVWLYPKVQFTNDPFPPSSIVKGITIKTMAVVCTSTVLMPGITIGTGAFVAAGSLVRKDVPDGQCVEGHPARIFGNISTLVSFSQKLRYPWSRNYRKNYPPQAQDLLDDKTALIDDLISQLKS